MSSPWTYVPFAVGSVLSLSGAYVCLRWYMFWRRNYNGELVTNGPYERVRHPFYSGFLAFVLGLALLFPVVETLMLATFSLAGILAFIPREEEFLVGQYGNNYRKYMKRVPWRLVPGVY